MQTKYKSIIFDLGGVLYDIDVKRSVKAFEDLGLKNFDKLYSLKEQTALFDKLETGKISKDEFMKNLRKYLPMSIKNEQVTDAWSALLIDMPQKNIDILLQLKDHYKLYLLSNTNEIHIDAINRYLQKHRNVKDIRDFFDKTYLSYEIGLRKPGVEIYEYVLKDARLNPEEALFIDDSEANLAGAKKAGINTLFKPRPDPLRNYIKPYMP